MSFTPSRSIRDGGVSHTSRYQLVKESLTWEEASQRCQEMGGHLTTITSQDEMDQLVQIAEDAGVKYVWLDGTEERHIMLWNIPSLGGWAWNGQRNDPAAVIASMAKDMAFVCEFES